jgi:hypothetical protein
MSLAFRLLGLLLLTQGAYCLAAGCLAVVMGSAASLCLDGSAALIAWCVTAVAISLAAGIACDPIRGRVYRMCLQPEQARQPADTRATTTGRAPLAHYNPTHDDRK